MSAEHGAYVELLTKGKIKRDLAEVSGEVSLDGTTVSDEVILFSELSFGPYAVVVDLIRFQAKAILKHDDHGGLADMTEFQAMLDTVEDLVSTLEEEFPLHGTLLRAQLEDEVPADDGTAMYPFLASRKILTILIEVMQFQFVVNEVLHDMQAGEPIVSEKYDTLWEVPVRSVLRWDGKHLDYPISLPLRCGLSSFSASAVCDEPPFRCTVPLLRPVFYPENEEENALL